jgi:hypothetical protein
MSGVLSKQPPNTKLPANATAIGSQRCIILPLKGSSRYLYLSLTG